MLFIAHDLAVVDHLCDRVVVLYLGRVMEAGRTDAVFGAPRHPYTRALLAAAPQIDPALRRAAVALSGELPSPISPPSGCVFRTRCPHAIAACAETVPVLAGDADHAAACIRQSDIG
jgi:oligopeptide/dipeptide ABC transporter ATP-binding protein